MGVLGRPLARTDDVFVGRAAELALLADELERARAGEPRVVWVEGEAGVGKTTLIDRATAAARGIVALRADGDQAETHLPFGVLDQLLAGVVGARCPGPGDDPASVGAELLGVLGTLQADGVVVLVVDDAPWADAASTRALVFAVRRLRHDRVLVLLGARPDADGREPWERLIATGSAVRRLDLGGLAPGELSGLAAALGRPVGSAGAAQRLWEHTRGTRSTHAPWWRSSLPRCSPRPPGRCRRRGRSPR